MEKRACKKKKNKEKTIATLLIETVEFYNVEKKRRRKEY